MSPVVPPKCGRCGTAAECTVECQWTLLDFAHMESCGECLDGIVEDFWHTHVEQHYPQDVWWTWYDTADD